MKRKIRTPEQIVKKLRQADARLAEGAEKQVFGANET